MGHKKASFQHADSLASMPWDEFERLMARHYGATPLAPLVPVAIDCDLASWLKIQYPQLGAQCLVPLKLVTNSNININININLYLILQAMRPLLLPRELLHHDALEGCSVHRTNLTPWPQGASLTPGPGESVRPRRA